LTNKSNLFFHYTARFPRHARSLVKRQPLAHSVRNPPGLFCQGCAQSVPMEGAPPPPGTVATLSKQRGCKLGSSYLYENEEDSKRQKAAKQGQQSEGSS